MSTVSRVTGGLGTDTISFSFSSQNMIISLVDGFAADAVGGNATRVEGFENVVGSDRNDTIFGTSGDNVLDGGEWGSDTLFGLGGNDTISYGSSKLSVLINLTAQAAADGFNTDTFFGFQNAIGSGFGDIIVSSDAANRIDGGGGLDTVSYDLSARSQLINLAGGAATDGVFTDTLLSIENAIGSRFSDVMHGNAFDNVLDGGAGGSDQINGADGSDTVSYSFSPRGVLINLASQATADGIDTDTLSSIENAIGSGFGDIIFSSDAANRIDGGAPASTRCPTASRRAAS